jgi:hypothetical protein
MLPTTDFPADLIRSTVLVIVGTDGLEAAADPVDAAATPPPEATASAAPTATSLDLLNRNRIRALRASAYIAY